MKKFLIQISHTEYAEVEITAKNEQKAEELAFTNMDCASWGNDETEIVSIEEADPDKK